MSIMLNFSKNNIIHLIRNPLNYILNSIAYVLLKSSI